MGSDIPSTAKNDMLFTEVIQYLDVALVMMAARETDGNLLKSSTVTMTEAVKQGL